MEKGGFLRMKDGKKIESGGDRQRYRVWEPER